MEEEIPTIQLFQDFIVDILCKITENYKPFTHSIIRELKTTLGHHPIQVLDDYGGFLDFDPANEWCIPQCTKALTTIGQACDIYISQNPKDLSSDVFNYYKKGIIELKTNYVDKSLHAINAVYPVMKEATEYNNVALVNIAFLCPKQFWTCFWENFTGLTSILHDEDDENDNIRLLNFIQLPIREHILSRDPNQRQFCKAMLQKIIYKAQTKKHESRVLHLDGRAFNEAMSITGLIMHP